MKAAGGVVFDHVTKRYGDVAAVDGAFEQIVEWLGAPTILVNNAGIIRDNLLFKMTVEEWDKEFALSLGMWLNGEYLPETDERGRPLRDIGFLMH